MHEYVVLVDYNGGEDWEVLHAAENLEFAREMAEQEFLDSENANVVVAKILHRVQYAGG